MTQDTIRLYNPLLHDFEYIWYDEFDLAHQLVLPSLVITTLPNNQGEFMLQHLADEVMNDRGRTKETTEIQLARIKNEILIHDEL